MSETGREVAHLALITINAREKKKMRTCNSLESKTLLLILVHCLPWAVGLKDMGQLKEKEHLFRKLAGVIGYLM